MRIRCGRCQTAFDVAGPGDHICPACGTRNRVAAPSQSEPSQQDRAPTPAPDYERIVCPQCSFRFVVGEVDDTVICPNCRADVPTGSRAGAGAQDG